MRNSCRRDGATSRMAGLYKALTQRPSGKGNRYAEKVQTEEISLWGVQVLSARSKFDYSHTGEHSSPLRILSRADAVSTLSTGVRNPFPAAGSYGARTDYGSVDIF